MRAERAEAIRATGLAEVEVKKADAVGFVDRGMRKEIAFLPDLAAEACPECKECFPLCPTSYVQARYVLLENLPLP